MLEKTVEKHLVDRVTAAGGRAYKFVSPNNRGVFDRVVVMPRGAIWFVEVKSPTGRLSKLQERFRDAMIAMGHKTAVVYSKDAVDNLMTILEREQHVD